MISAVSAAGAAIILSAVGFSAPAQAVTGCWNTGNALPSGQQCRNFGAGPGGAGQVISLAHPTFSGFLQVGQTLSSTPGLWSTPSTLKYQWLRNGVVIPGATGKTYKLKAADKGKSITLRVTASSKTLKDRVETTLPSPKVGFSLGTYDSRSSASGTAPVLTGSSSVGSTLSALDLGTWSPGGIALKMQWQVNGVDIASTAEGTYQIRLSDVGKKIRLKVTTTSWAGAVYPSRSKVSKSITATSATVGIGDCYMDIPDGTTVGRTVSVIDGAWFAGTARVTYTRQWLSNGKPIAGATKKSYKLTAADKGKKIEVRITGSARGYRPASHLVRESFVVG